MYTLEDLKREITAATLQAWESERSPLLISKLGLSGLSDEARQYVREQKISLKRFVRTHLLDSLRLVPMPRHGGGVAPLASTAGLSDSQLDAMFTPKKPENEVETRQPLFYSEVWAAFRDAVPDGQRRILRFEDDKPVIYLQPCEKPLPEGEYSIDNSDTAITSHPDRPASAADIRAAITNWCEAKGVPFESLMRPTRVASAKKDIRRPSATLDSASFIAVFRSIPREQLAKISFPGDAVLSILERLDRR